MRITRPFALLVFLLFTSSAALAQFQASILGTVTDTTGAVIPGATITLTSTSTKVTRTTTSTGQGFYQFSELAPGTYDVVITAPNFKQATFNSVEVAAERPRTLDAQLATGAAAATVTVNGSEVPVLQTSNGSVQSTISTEQILRLPTSGRDPYELLRTVVGVVGEGSRSGSNGSANYLPNQGAGGVGQSNSGIFQTENQVQVSAAGQRPTSNTYLLDGVSVDSLSHGGAAVITPSEESVDQITTTATSFTATDGRKVGLIIQTVTKSGSNQLHGSGAFLYDEPGLNAYNSYGGPDGALPYRNNNKMRDWAASLGGPIYRNKLFFFLSYEGFKQRNISYGNQWIETPEFDALIAQQRGGSIASRIVGLPGITPRVVKVLTSPGCAFFNTPTYQNNPSAYCRQTAGGGLDIGSPTGAQGQYVPIGATANPTVGNAWVGGGFDGIPDIEYAQVQAPSRQRGNQYHARVDYYLTQHDQLLGSVFVSKLAQRGTDLSTGARPDSDIPFKPLNHTGTAAWIHTFSPNLINELRANYTRFSDNQIADASGAVNFGLPRIGIQDLPSGQQVQIGIGQSSTTPAVLAQNTYEVRDTLIHTFGAQTLSIGGQFRWEQDNNNNGGNNRPIYTFFGPWNFFNDAPIFEAISANPDTGGPANAQRYLRSHDIAGFAQDDWKVTPNLTLNLGLRWEYFSPLANKGMRVNQPIFGSGANYLIGATLEPVDRFFNPDYNNWGPKFGFAWSPAHFNNTLVVRGGFGMSYDRFDDILYSNAVENGPGYFYYNICCGTASTDFGTPLAGGQISYALGTSNSPTSYPANPALATGVDPVTHTPRSFNGTKTVTPQVETYGALRTTNNPYLYSYALEVQKELPKQFVLGVGYQGSVGHGFIRLVNQNFLHATQSGTCLTDSSTCTVGVNQTPFYASYVPTPDVYTNYNGVNVHASRRYSNGVQVDVVYTYSKSLDQLSTAGPGAQSNQTNPAHPETEYGPSDFDTRHRVTATALYEVPKFRGGKGLLGQILSGWQANGIFTFHTGFPWTPVTQKLNTTQVVTSAATLSPVRPLAYYGGARSSCSNELYIQGTNFADKSGGATGGLNYFNVGPPPNGAAYTPGIGRNSFRGPCYYDTDVSVAKQQQFGVADHPVTVRFQANAYNVFNTTNLAPFSFGSNNTTIENPDFGIAPGSDTGRIVEFTARFQF